jgi:hypothetical protein
VLLGTYQIYVGFFDVHGVYLFFFLIGGKEATVFGIYGIVKEAAAA